MITNYFPNRTTKKILEANKLGHFDAAWELELEWFEPPNHRGEGWSGNSRHTITDLEGNSVNVFIKRQSNYCYRTIKHPINGVPTLQREFNNMLALWKTGVGTSTPLYYGQSLEREESKAILVTLALDQFTSLEDWEDDDSFSVKQSIRIVEAIARTLKKLHRHKLQHGCMYAKHVFIRSSATGETQQGQLPDTEIRIIDLERTQRRVSRSRAAIHDIDQLFRHSPDWFRKHYRHFLACYDPGLEKLLHKRLCRLWARRAPDRRPTGIDLAG